MSTNRLCLKNPLRGACPPGGYRWVCPVDGWVSHAWDYRTWVEQAKRHYAVNQLAEPASLEADMQEQLCLTLEEGWCLYDDPNRYRVVAALGWNDVLEGIKTFGRWLKEGAKTVGQAEAERRSEICLRCYFNVHIEGCSACQRLVQEVVGALQTKHDNALKGCAVCKCVLRAKVHFPIETLDKENDKLQSVYPEHCWLKKDGSNYVGSTDVPR